MTSAPRVSIGVPVYNGERFLGRTLDSLRAQSFTDFELIISDNASTDGTRSICMEYAARDARIRYVPSPVNNGAAWNMNRVVELATGEYFKWAMADDLCVDSFLAQCVAVLDRDPGVVLVCSRTMLIDESDKELKRVESSWNLQSPRAEDRLRHTILWGGHWVNADALQGVIRRAALARTHLVPRYQGGDKRPIAELSLAGRFVELPEFLLLRRTHDQSSGTNNMEFAADKAAAKAWTIEFFKGTRGHIMRPTWTLLGDHALVVLRSDLSVASKAKLLGAVLRCMRWNWRRLYGELVASASSATDRRQLVA
jgi:glycosyltransferase involved in cell wall biosynthesis